MRRTTRWGALLIWFMLPLTLTLNAQTLTIIGPDSYPQGTNPLTGLPVGDAALLQRRPLLVKISNFPVIVRQYQAGLNEADVVWEHLLAGGVTRFSAIFLGSDQPKVGPIRSGRLVDFELTRIYRSLYTYSGMSEGTLQVLRGDGLVSSRAVGGSGPCPALCRYPQEGLALEHTLFGDTEALRQEASARDRDTAPEPVYGMAFSKDVRVAGVPINRASIQYRGSAVGWEWDEASGRWLRLQDGEPHVDGNGVRISAANVVILEEEHTEQPFVRDQYWGPANFAFSVNFIGSGRVYFLRDGQIWQGEWRRETREDPLTFFDVTGETWLFRPGNTFFGLVPRWIDGYELAFDFPDPQQVVVIGETGVSMRTGPGEAYRAPDVAYGGDAFVVVGRNFDGTWVQVQRAADEVVWLPVARLDMGNLDPMVLFNTRPSIER